LHAKIYNNRLLVNKALVAGYVGVDVRMGETKKAGMTGRELST
jgi:hypothetical protein